MEIAQRIRVTKRLFNINQHDNYRLINYDVLPHRLMNEPLPSGRAEGSKTFDNEEDFKKSLQLLYKKRGLDEIGIPKKEEIEKLEIS